MEYNANMRAPHYTVVEDTVIDDERVSGNALLVYLALRRHVNADGSCWPSWARIAKVSRLKRTAVAEALLEIEAAGYIHREPRVGQSSIYTVTIPVRSADAPRPPGGLPPVRSADPEVTPLEVASLKEDPSPSGDTPEEVLEPVAKSVAKRLKTQLKKRGEAWQHAADLTVARGGPWAAGAKEAVSMDKLVAWAMLKAPGRGGEFIADFLEGAWALKRGDVLGLSTKDLGFWASQPYTPSRLLCHAMAICAALEHLEESNRPLTPQQMKMMGAP